MKQLAKAIKIAAEAFEGKVDRGGQPYILHCLRVMNAVDQKDEALMCIAVLHDIQEDVGHIYTSQFLSEECLFNDRIIRALICLTHDKEAHSYEEYIKIISNNEDAKKVKLADLKDNSDITRLKGLRKKDFDRMEKYHKAYTYLQD